LDELDKPDNTDNLDSSENEQIQRNHRTSPVQGPVYPTRFGVYKEPPSAPADDSGNKETKNLGMGN